MDELEYANNDANFTSYHDEYLHRLGVVKESMESLDRLSTSYGVLSSYMSDKDLASMESDIRPMLELALAGTGIEIKEYSPEGALEVVKSMGNALIQMIKRLFTNLIDLISNFDLQATWLLRNVSLLERKRVTSRGKVPSEPHITIGRQNIHLRIGRLFVNDSSTLDRELNRLLKVIKVMSDDLTPALAQASTKIINQSPKTGSNLVNSLLEAVEDIGFSRIATKLSMTNTSKDRWGRLGGKETSPLLGGKSLFLLDGNLGERGLAGLRSHGFVYSSTYSTPFTIDETKEFRTLTTSDLNGIPDLLKEILMTLSKKSSGIVISNMKKMRDNLDTYLKGVSNSKDLDEADLREIRRTVSALTYWAGNVINPLYGTSMQICRTVITYGLNSTKTYK